MNTNKKSHLRRENRVKYIDADGIRMRTAAFLSGCAAPDFPFYRYWVSRSP